MKKTAVLLYDSFCNFESSVALEILALEQKEVTFFAAEMSPVKSEDGMTVIPDQTIFQLNPEEYDSLLLPGAADIRQAIENPDILDFIRKFRGKVIGAISIAPLLLVKAGLLNGKPFLAGINREEVLEEGFSQEDLRGMIGWNDNLKHPVEAGYLLSDQILTSVSYQFVRFGLAFAKLLGIDISPKTFGI